MTTLLCYNKNIDNINQITMNNQEIKINNGIKFDWLQASHPSWANPLVSHSYSHEGHVSVNSALIHFIYCVKPVNVS